MITGRAESIAEYAMLRWLKERNFALECFDLTVSLNRGVLKDQMGESMVLVYEPRTKSVSVKDEAEKSVKGEDVCLERSQAE